MCVPKPYKIDAKARRSLRQVIQKRIIKLKASVKIDTQRIRSKTLTTLEGLFDLAVLIAKGKIKFQTENGKAVRISLKQRQMWARIAAYIAQIMNGIAQGFDEKQIDLQLTELERLVGEAEAKSQTGKPEKPTGELGVAK